MKINRRIFKKKKIITGELPYFLGNVLVGVRVVFLSNCPLVLSLFKHRGIGVFLNIKMRNPNIRSPLNNSIGIARVSSRKRSLIEWS